MELHAGERAAFGDGNDAFRRRDRAGGVGRIGVREVERRSEEVDVGPPDARDAAVAQAHGSAGQQSEALDAAVLLRLLERQLKAEADAEDGAAAFDALAQDLVEPAAAKPFHRRAGGADAGEDGEVCACRVVGEAGAEPRERDLDRAGVAGAVVADRDVQSNPFVDGIPSLSTRTATRKARPTALN